MRLRLTILIAYVTLSSALHGQFRIDYLGNMGVAISHNDSVIFIDAFHSFYKESYLRTSPEKFTKVLQLERPYRYGVAAMVTHYHRDHVDPAMLEMVLDAYPTIKLVCGNQVRKLMDTTQQKRMSKLILVENEIETIIQRNISIKAVKIWHANYFLGQRFAKTDNYYFLIEWSGKHFLHVGDAETVERNFTSLNKVKGTIDYLLVPDWFVYDSSSVELINKYIQPKHIIVLHVDPNGRSGLPLTTQPTTIFKTYNDYYLSNDD